ncbi:MAG: hypothetical protein JSU69_01520 [Candidatus Zixiibacteriota bacterium]|nr:MAG: hypothetical protein JSU69_01520 [candidate division Zixibacteria bacterium]
MKRALAAGLPFFVLAVIAFPIGTMQHELGHVLAAKLADIPVKLSYTSVHEPIVISQQRYFYLALGGPLATWIFAVAAFVFVYVRKKKGLWPEGTRPSIWQVILTCIAMFSARSLLDGFFFISTGFQGAAGDERIILGYLNMPLIPIVLIEIIAAALIAVTVFRCISIGYRLGSVAGFIFGVFFGLYFWCGVLGPVILP